MSRRKAREAALKALYRIDLVGGDAREALADLRVPDASRAYASFLVEGVLAHLAEIDAEISAHLIDWTLDRLSPVDRAILRIGTFELLHSPDVPPRVSLDEAIELAKRYSDDRAPAFVNGVLASIYRERRLSEASGTGPNSEDAPDSGSEPEEEGRR